MCDLYWRAKYAVFNRLNDLDEDRVRHRFRPLCWLLDAFNEGRI